MKIHTLLSLPVFEGRRRDIVANVLDFDLVVNEFELQPHYHVQFLEIFFGNGMNPLIPPPHSYELISITTVLLQG